MGHKGGHWKNALYALQYAKGTCLAKVTSNSEKIKPVALTVIELRLSEGISQLLSQLVSPRNFPDLWYSLLKR